MWGLPWRQHSLQMLPMHSQLKSLPELQLLCCRRRGQADKAVGAGVKSAAASWLVGVLISLRLQDWPQERRQGSPPASLGGRHQPVCQEGDTAAGGGGVPHGWQPGGGQLAAVQVLHHQADVAQEAGHAGYACRGGRAWGWQVGAFWQWTHRNPPMGGFEIPDQASLMAAARPHHSKTRRSLAAGRASARAAAAFPCATHACPLPATPAQRGLQAACWVGMRIRN